jgi:hypothetical protein
MASAPSAEGAKCSENINDTAAAPHIHHRAQLDALPTELRLQIFSYFLPFHSILCEESTSPPDYIVRFDLVDDQTWAAVRETIPIQSVCRLFHREIKSRLHFRLAVHRWTSVHNFQAQCPSLALYAINSLTVKIAYSTYGVKEAVIALTRWQALGSLTYPRYLLVDGRMRPGIPRIRDDPLQVLEDIEVQRDRISEMGFCRWK